MPPIQGLPLDLLGIRLFGWKAAFVYAEVGIMAGAMCAFYTARLNRSSLERLLVARGINSERWIKLVSVSPRFRRLLLVRLLSNPVFDLVSYSAGLTSISPMAFFWATLLGNIPSVLILFLLGDVVASRASWWFAVGLVALIIWAIIRWRLETREASDG